MKGILKGEQATYGCQVHSEVTLSRSPATPMVTKNKSGINYLIGPISADDYYSGGVSFEQTMKLDQIGTNFGDDGNV